MSKSKRLIVGLGNPGPEYEATRHNIGFEAADAVAARARATFERGRGNVLLGWGRIRSYPVGVAKPLTFMNRSGKAISALLGVWRMEPRQLLVIVDDINLPPGRLRLRPSGSAGGHNGLQDIADRLGHPNFPRLRIGVGNDFARGGQARHVLSPFSSEERLVMDEAVIRARDAVETFVCEGISVAMNRFNKDVTQ